MASNGIPMGLGGSVAELSHLGIFRESSNALAFGIALKFSYLVSVSGV
jgi:hypothetical protein